tara:strand:+ start:1627 stop:4233 length:2607 start_codon:yes stop_codon:yes gene_type:complete
MNEPNIIQQQLNREDQQRKTAFKKWQKDLKEQTQRSDGSNTDYAKHWKRHTFSNLLEGLQNEIDDPNKYVRSSRATDAIRRCLGTQLVHKKNKDNGKDELLIKQRKNFFNLEVCSFIAYQITLDNSMAPRFEFKIIDIKTGKPKRNKERINKDALILKIGKAIEDEIQFMYISSIYPQYFDSVNKYAAGGRDGTSRSSTYYWRSNVKRAIKKKQEELRGQEKFIEADALDWKPFSNMDRKHVGNWLLSGLLKYTGVFKEERHQLKDRQNLFIVLSDEAESNRDQYIEQHEKYCMDEVPMICEPVPATKEYFGSWLTTIETSRPYTNKGSLEISDQHIDYINKLQSVPYKINDFVLQVMDLLVEQNIKLGKFQPHTYVEPLSIVQRLGLNSDIGIENHPRFKEAKKERSKELNRQIALTEKGKLSTRIWRSAKQLVNYPTLYFPASWDFRGRVYIRCSNSPSPQGSDYSKALLKFSNAIPIDQRTKHFLAIDLANHAGMDKLNFDDRLKWTERHIAEIKLVATMLEPGGNPSAAVAFLSDLDDPFQFIASAEEYYHCFIVQDRKQTSVRVGVDATCSGAAVMAAIRRCKTGARLVNVFPSPEPKDLYRACWDALVELNSQYAEPLIRPSILNNWTTKKYGRKAAKLMIMVAQYGAGDQKQMDEFWQFHDQEVPTKYKLIKEEFKAVRKLWFPAMKRVCSFTFVLDWFQKKVQEIYDSGAKEVIIPTPVGSIQIMNYPEYDIHRVKSFHHGNLNYKMSDYQPTDKPDINKWISAITANTVHSIDSSVMVLSFDNFPYDFSTIHDAAYTYAGEPMDFMIKNLKEGFIKACSFNIWDEFRKANNLPIDPKSPPPIVGNLDLDSVRQSDYIFS